MDIYTFALLPMASLILGAGAGFVVGRWIGTRGFLWLIGLTSAVALFLVIRLTGVGPGEEEKAFGPFIWLTGGVLPFLFAVIAGGLGGRSLAARSGQ